MERYKNLGGNSGVVAYELGDNSIKIQFRNGSLYLYDDQSTGKDIEHMKKLAISGQGLSSFISRNVKERYAAKLK
jgi:hypothetical protein